MDGERLRALLECFPQVRLLVLGDFFLDKYLEIDHALAEISLETGLEAHQVVGVRVSPGGAGNVAANLRALGAQVSALTILGDDGEGYELLRSLREQGVALDAVLQARERVTPTYTKPMMHEPDGRVHELSRLDIKNRARTPQALEEQLMARLEALAPRVQGIIVADQVPERNCGVVTDAVRAALQRVQQTCPQLPIVVDSRVRAGEFTGVMLKPNDREALRAVGQEPSGPVALGAAEAAGRALSERTGRTAFVTVGEQGTLVCEGQGCERVPAVPVTGEIDIVGAGDSALAGLTAALCAGATPREAALVGNLVASVTIRCLGTTGTASPSQVLEVFARWQAAR